MAIVNFEMPSFVPALPEMFVLGMACFILILDLFIKQQDRVITYLLSVVTLVGAAILVFLHSTVKSGWRDFS